MGFFDRNRSALAEQGIDPSRLPPGQYATDRFPVLHVGDVPTYRDDLSNWSIAIGGLVDREVELSWTEILALPSIEVTCDIHCVTKWSKFNTTWKGVEMSTLFDLVGVKPEATHVLQTAEYGYTTNTPFADLIAPRTALLAYEFGGLPLEAEHGYPARLIVPHLYLWKGAKWVRRLDLLDRDRAGFWERNGYHMYGDPFREQRFTND